MSQVIEPHLDRTTYYSILGLTSNATSSEVHKSYLKLARLLHPDKTKSDKCEDLFKAVVHAHSILTDKDQKLRYDRDLKIKGLYTYQQKKYCYTFKNKVKEPHETNQKPTKSEIHHRQGKPYEQQPYGFGVGKKVNTSSKSKVPIFKSFNLKGYQRNHYYSFKKENKHETPDADSLFHETNGASKVRMTSPSSVNASSPFQEIWETLGKKTSNDESSCREKSVLNDEEEVRYHAETTMCSSPEEYQKYNEESKKERRNLSKEDTEEEMEYKQFKLPKINVFSNESSEPNLQSPFYNHEYRHYARSKFQNRNQNRRSVSPTKEMPTTSKTAEGWNILRDIVEKLNISSVDDGNKDTSLRKSQTNEKSYSETINIEELSIREPKGIKRRKKDGISLEELSKSLPEEKDFFVMNAINESLDSINLFKRPKTVQSQTSSDIQREGNNVQSELSLEQYGITSNVLSLKIPEILEFNASTDLKTLKLNVQMFNNHCNELKEELLQASLRRYRADMQLGEKLMEKQNIVAWKTCLEFDRSLTEKMRIVQARQMQVVDNFSKQCASSF